MKKIAIILLSLCASAFAQEKVFAPPANSNNLDEDSRKTLAAKVLSAVIEQGRGIYRPVEQSADANLNLFVLAVEAFDTMLVCAYFENKSSIVEAATFTVGPLKTMPDLESISHKIASNLLERRKKFVSGKPEIDVGLPNSNIGIALKAIIGVGLANSGDFNLSYSPQYGVIGNISSVLDSDILSFSIVRVKNKSEEILKSDEVNLSIGKELNNSAKISNLERAASKVIELAKQASLHIEIFTDSRDGKTYRILNTNDGTWFIDDLSYSNKKLYTWNEAMNSCPSGWRLPNNGDWAKLVSKIEGSSTFGKAFTEFYGGDGLWSAAEGYYQEQKRDGREYFGLGSPKYKSVSVYGAESWNCNKYYESSHNCWAFYGAKSNGRSVRCIK
jgi:uncharacterized protein (TIGR02145 family)